VAIFSVIFLFFIFGKYGYSFYLLIWFSAPKSQRLLIAYLYRKAENG